MRRVKVPNSVFSSMSREARRKIRQKRAAESKNTGVQNSIVSKQQRWITFFGVGGIISFFSWSVSSYAKDTAIGDAVQDSYPWRWILAQTSEVTKSFTEPIRQKLLPDWPFFPNIPADTPCPPTLVLDLEGTLVKSTWDRRHGWRHAKRPGVDKFLKDMAQYYEIVLFSSNIGANVEPIMMSLDPENICWHKLTREATRYENGVYIKDLSYLNRSLKKMVIIDDDEQAFSLQPENGIRINAFKNARDKNDTSLHDIGKFLAALVHEGVEDFPALLSTFKSRNAEDISNEYLSKLRTIKDREEESRNRGLGRLVKSLNQNITQRVDLESSPALASSSSLLSSADIVTVTSDTKATVVPPPAKSGALFSWFENRRKEAEEDQRRKAEAWNEVMRKKEQERKDREAASF